MDGSFESHELDDGDDKIDQPCLLSKHVQAKLGMVKHMRSGRITLEGGREINSYLCKTSGLTCICISDFAIEDGRITCSKEVESLRVGAPGYPLEASSSPDVERQALMAGRRKKKRWGKVPLRPIAGTVTPSRVHHAVRNIPTGRRSRSCHSV